MSNSFAAFEREFRAGDIALFQELTDGICGARLSRVRETYADGIVLDCGEIRLRDHKPKAAVVIDRGEYTITSWGCDVTYLDATSERVFRKPAAILKRLKSLAGTFVSKLELEYSSLSLTVTFASGSELRFETDFADPEIDQWFITLATGASIGVAPTHKWYYRQARI